MQASSDPADPASQYLQKSGFITAEMARTAADRAASHGERFTTALVRSGAAAGDDLVRALLRKGKGGIEVDGLLLDPVLLRLLPQGVAFEAGFLPVHRAEGILFAAVPRVWSRPTPVPELEQALGVRIELLPVDRVDAPGLLIKGLHLLRRRIDPASAPQEPQPVSAPTASEDPEPVRLLTELVGRALDEGATDLYLDPVDDRIELRFRIDGRLRTRPSGAVSPANAGRLTAHLRRAAGIDPTGRFRVAAGAGRIVEVRSTLRPTPRGDSAALRLLDPAAPIPTLEQLGFPEALARRLVEAAAQAQGLVLLVGPTGCGKTATAYAMIAALRARGAAVGTMEDPIDRPIEGVDQRAANLARGEGHVRVLEAILDKDPDAILVGEIRHRETAAVAVRAAVTGPVVVATLQASDAVGAVRRLRDFGVDPQLLSLGLRCVTYQRLLRRICPQCTAESGEDAAALEDLGLEALLKGVPLRRGAGCAACGKEGYRGRIAVTEHWVPDDGQKELIARDSNDRALRALAYSKGLRPLIVDALDCVRVGATTLEELQDVVPYNQLVRAREIVKPS